MGDAVATPANNGIPGAINNPIPGATSIDDSGVARDAKGSTLGHVATPPDAAAKPLFDMSQAKPIFDMSKAEPISQKPLFDMSKATPIASDANEGFSQATGLSADKAHSKLWTNQGVASKYGIPTIEEQKNFLEDVMNDVKNGTDNSWVGSLLRKMGAKGTSYGVPESVGTTMAGPVLGIPQAAHGLLNVESGHPIKGVNEMVAGAGQTLGPVAVAQPEALPFIALAEGGSKIGNSTAKALGADDDTAELIGNVAGLVAGGKGIGKGELSRFETSVNTHMEAQNEYTGRIREHQNADAQAVTATQQAEAARAAELANAKENAAKADRGEVIDRAQDQKLRQETIAAQDNASAARANAKKARQALTEAEEVKNQTGYNMRQAASEMQKPAPKPKTPSTELHDQLAAKEDYENVIEPAKKGKKGYYDDADREVRDRYAEAAHKDKPIQTVEDEHQMLEDSIESIDQQVKAAAAPYGSQPIATNPKMDVVDALAEREGSRANWTQKGLASLEEDYNLTDPTIDESLKNIHDLNDELRNWDGKKSDPAYVAKSAAVQSLRNGVMQALEKVGVNGVADMRSDMASLYRVRDAAYNALGKGDKIIRGSGGSGVLRKAAVLGGQAAIHSAGVGAGSLIGGTLLPGAGHYIGGIVGEGLVKDYAHNFGKKYGVADLTRNEALQRRMQKTVSTGAIPEARGGNPNIALPGAEAIPVTRDASPLHADLASHYGQRMGTSTYQQLEDRFFNDLANKQKSQLPLEPAEKQLLTKINQQDHADIAAQQEAAQQAAIDAASKGQPVVPQATLPVNGVEPQEIPAAKLKNSRTVQEALTHELVHDYVKNQTVGDKLPSLGIRSEVHPQNVKRGNTATAAFDWSHYYDADDKLDVNKVGGDIDELATILMSGGVADELWHDIPITENHGLSGDFNSLQELFKVLDFTPEEQTFIVARAGARAKEMLSAPGLRDLIEQHTGTREPGLDKEFHFSPTRLEQITKDLEGHNEKTSKSAGDSGTPDRGTKKDGAGGKGEVQEELARPVRKARKGNAETNSRPVEESAAAIKPSNKAEELNPALSAEERKIGTMEPHSFGYMRGDGSIEQAPRSEAADSQGNWGIGTHDDLAQSKGEKMSQVLSEPGAVKYGTGQKRGFVKIENENPKTVTNALKVINSLPTDDVDFEFANPNNAHAHQYFEGSAKQVAAQVRRQFANPQEYELGEDLNPALSHPAERTTGVKEHDEAIRAAGAIPGGHLTVPGEEPRAMYHDPATGNTLATKFSEVNPQYITNHLQESRAQYATHQAVESAKKTGGFTFNPKTGEVPKSGYQVELFPERRQVLTGAPTANDIQEFTKKNQDVLTQHPELHVGGYGNELNISGRFADETAAKNAAKNLDQISIWDNKNQAEVPTGGVGRETQFAQYPPAQRLQDLGARETPFAQPKGTEATPFAKPKTTSAPAEPVKLPTQDFSRAIPTSAQEELAAVTPELEAREARRVERQRDLNRAFGEATKGEDLNPALSAKGMPKGWKSLSDDFDIVAAPRGTVEPNHITDGGGWWLKTDGSWVGSRETPEGYTQEHQSTLQQVGNDPANIRVAAPNTFDVSGGNKPTEAQLAEMARMHKASGEDKVVWELPHEHADDFGDRPSGEGSFGDFRRAIEKAFKNKGEDLNPALSAHTISTRVPSGVKATEDPMKGEPLHIGRAAVEAAPEKLQDKFSQKAREVPGTKIPKNITDNAKVYDRFVNHAAENLKWIWNQVPEATRQANARWYESAHGLTKDVADQHGYTHPQVAGVTAALSPQMDWDMNVSLMKRLTDIHKNHMNEVVSPEMMQKGKDIVAGSRKANPEANANLQEILSRIQGKKISDLTGWDRAAAVRLYDETSNPREFPRIDPGTGQEMETRTNADGSPSDIAWGNLTNIDKALSILDDGSRQNISDNVGDSHKVRNFYNNIIDPSDPNSVTIDTHAVNAGSLLPMGGNLSKTMPLNKIVNDNFGAGGKNLGNGIKGTYSLWADAYRKAAKDLGVLPREMQSVTWEKIRDMFPAEWKTPATQKAVAGEWQKYSDGKQSLDQTRGNILKMTQDAQKAVEAVRAKQIAKAQAPGRINALDFIDALRQSRTGGTVPEAGLAALGGR